MAMIVLDLGQAFASFGKVLVVVQVARIARDAVIVAHIDRLRHLLACHKGFKQFLSMTRADHLHLRIQILRIDLRVCLFQRLCQDRQSSRRRLLNKEISIFSMHKCINTRSTASSSVIMKRGHIRICDRNCLATHHLLHPKEEYRTHGLPSH